MLRAFLNCTLVFSLCSGVSALTVTTPAALSPRKGSCPANCTISHLAWPSYYWASITLTTTYTHTVILIVDEAHHTTITSTKTVAIPPSEQLHHPAPTNAAGTVTAKIQLQSCSSCTTTLAYPTKFIDYPPGYPVEGTYNSSGVCLTGSYTLWKSSELALLTQPAPTIPKGGDKFGTLYTIDHNIGDWPSGFAESMAARSVPWKECVRVMNAPAAAVQGALVLTTTEVSTLKDTATPTKAPETSLTPAPEPSPTPPPAQTPTPSPQNSPSPEPVNNTPSPQPVQTTPLPESVQNPPSPQPVQSTPSPQPVQSAPLPEPIQTTPSPVQNTPLSEPVQTTPSPVGNTPSPIQTSAQPSSQAAISSSVTQTTSPVTGPDASTPSSETPSASTKAFVPFTVTADVPYTPAPDGPSPWLSSTALTGSETLASTGTSIASGGDGTGVALGPSLPLTAASANTLVASDGTVVATGGPSPSTSTANIPENTITTGTSSNGIGAYIWSGLGGGPSTTSESLSILSLPNTDSSPLPSASSTTSSPLPSTVIIPSVLSLSSTLTLTSPLTTASTSTGTPQFSNSNTTPISSLLPSTFTNTTTPAASRPTPSRTSIQGTGFTAPPVPAVATGAASSLVSSCGSFFAFALVGMVLG